jgi:2-dehydro-3-deoxygalactonokinase
MPRADKLIAIDWGTTNRRAWLLDAVGTCLSRFADDRGVLSIKSFPDAVADVRSRLGDHVLLMAGMVGSNRGWVEAPYLSCPVGLADLVRGLVWPEPGRAAIVPGVRLPSGGRADVMRGEEVQALGAVAAGVVPRDVVVCHPGTHAKWIVIRDGKIVDFRTVMTGELFDLLRTHSILSTMLAHEVAVDDAFREGARQGIANGTPAADLFSVRARVLVGELAARDAGAFASGLLIGADVRIGLAQAACAEIVVIGSPRLAALYRAALGEAGHVARVVDGEAAFLAGIERIAEAV